nr:putative trehalose-phosphatase (C-terminal fragment) [Saccharum hybrid cultivar R570]
MRVAQVGTAAGGRVVRDPMAGAEDRTGMAQAAVAVRQDTRGGKLPVLEEVYAALVSQVEPSIPGAKVENNKFCLSVHFRCVGEHAWAALFEQVRAVLKDYPGLRLTQGRKVLEVRPMIRWDKGKALKFLLSALGFADAAAAKDDVFPIYVGDDREDAFRVLRARRQGAAILVSRFPKVTSASFTLRDPAELKEFLRKIVVVNADTS